MDSSPPAYVQYRPQANPPLSGGFLLNMGETPHRPCGGIVRVREDDTLALKRFLVSFLFDEIANYLIGIEVSV